MFIGVEEPLVPDADTAQSLVLEELARSEYDMTADPVTRFFRWLFGLLFSLSPEGDVEIPTQVIVLTGFILLLIILGVAVILNPIRLSKSESSTVWDDQAVTLAQSQENLQRAIAQAKWDEAIVWAFRCQALILDELKVIRVAPGLTAQEVARAASEQFTSHAEAFTNAAATFDKVRYGDSAVTSEDFRPLAELLDIVSARRHS